MTDKEPPADVGRNTEVQEKENYFAPGTEPDHQFGVLYQGEWETPFDGTAIAVRKHARALSNTGLPVVLKSFSNVVVSRDGIAEPVPTVGISDEVKKEVGSLHLTKVGAVMPIIKHVVIASASRLSQMLLRGIAGPLDKPELRVAAQQAAYAATIVYSVWERSFVDPDIGMHLSGVGECWVPCEHNQELLRRVGVERVRVVPHPYDPDEDICKLTQRAAQGGDRKRFYAIGAWQPRKGFNELLGAFLRAYGPSQASLTIKFSGGQWHDYPSPEHSVASWLEDGEVRRNGWTSKQIAVHQNPMEPPPNTVVTLLGGRIRRSRIVELHYRNNIYVCSSRGEAWCLPAFEAKLAGNRLVHVAYGGTADFADPGDIEVPYKLVDVPRSYNWEPQAQWADFEQEALKRALIDAEPPERFAIPETFPQRFSQEAIGTQMREAVLALTDKLHPAASDYYRGLP